MLSICLDPCVVNLQTIFFFFWCLSTFGTQTQNINQRTSSPASRIPWMKREVFPGSASEGWRTFPCTTGYLVAELALPYGRSGLHLQPMQQSSAWLVKFPVAGGCCRRFLWNIAFLLYNQKRLLFFLYFPTIPTRFSLEMNHSLGGDECVLPVF